MVVEPDQAACLLASAELGQPTTVAGNLNTLMAGLACGEPSIVAWQELNRAACAFMAIRMRLRSPVCDCSPNMKFVGGESGLAGHAGYLLATSDVVAREDAWSGWLQPGSRIQH
jgi:diaminopropionate ammonia-lyase